jgi:hypothetical protein
MFFIISPEYLLHQSMPHHIILIQFNMCNAINILQDPHSGHETTSLVSWKIHLGNITGDNGFGIGADAGQKHFDLQVSGILRFI